MDRPCVCQEYLHIIGFSDGASTIGGWLNLGAVNTQPGDDFYGVIALIDVIREFNTTEPNIDDNATWTVSAMPAGRSVAKYTAFRNKSGSLLQCFTSPLWAGHQILTTPTPWANSALNQQNLCHTAFPDSTFVKLPLSSDITNTTLDLINSDLATGQCHCIAVSACPDLDGDGDVDLEDFDIFGQNITGPTSGSLVRGSIPGDIDLDGDVDLRDYGFFQQAFSAPAP